MKNIHIIEKHNGQILTIVHNGFAVGSVYRNGIVQSRCPYKGLAKLLNVDEAEVRKAWPEIYENRSQE